MQLVSVAWFGFYYKTNLKILFFVIISAFIKKIHIFKFIIHLKIILLLGPFFAGAFFSF